MTIRKMLKGATLVLALAAGASAANAGVWGGAGGSAVAMPAVNYFGAGPVAGSGYTWSSTNSSTQGGSVFGYTGGYGFSSNGNWSGTPMAGVNDASDVYSVVDTMTFAFDAPVSAFGGEINWVPNRLPVTIAAYDSSWTLIESLTLSAAGANLQSPDAFYGFIEGSASIKYFTLTDGYVGIRNMQAISESSGVPEPASWATLILGFFGIGSLLRRRSAVRAIA